MRKLYDVLLHYLNGPLIELHHDPPKELLCEVISHVLRLIVRSR